MKENELKIYAQLLTRGFLEDPGVVFQTKGLERAELLLSLQSEGQIQAFSEQNAVRVLEDGKGILIGYSLKELPEPLFVKLMQQSCRQLLEKATEEELQSMQKNAMLEIEIIPQNWHAKYFNGDVFHILIVAIDKSLKGTGAFRNLLMPVIQDCERKGMPIVVETFNPDNVPLYEHFGFELMESHHSEKIGLTCFCLMK